MAWGREELSDGGADAVGRFETARTTSSQAATENPVAPPTICQTMFGSTPAPPPMATKYLQRRVGTRLPGTTSFSGNFEVGFKGVAFRQIATPFQFSPPSGFRHRLYIYNGHGCSRNLNSPSPERATR